VRCDAGGTCVWIAGATDPAYVVSASDAGSSVGVYVTGSNALGSQTVPSSGTTWQILPFTAQSDHFTVHYASDPAAYTATISQTLAGDLAALAEHAYGVELAQGYPAPASDGGLGGDSRIDIYVTTVDPGLWGYASWNGLGVGYIKVSGANPSQVAWQGGIAHELFHLIQAGIWSSYPADDWLLEGSAEWMAYKVDATQRDPDLGTWDTSLDCADPPPESVKCDLTDRYKQVGYSRWPFFEYLTERYGSDFVKTIFAQGALGAGSPINAVSNALATKGGSFTDVFTDWTVANMMGSYSMSILQDLAPPLYAGPVAVGTLTSLNAKTRPGNPKVTSGPIPTVTVPVHHLSARYVALERGDPTAPDTPCYSARLKLSIAVPNVGGRPFFWWSQKNKDGTNMEKAVPLDVNNGTATIDVPWDTCDWGPTTAYLVLPNPSTSLDARDFTISGTLTVDTGTQATATPPPDPVKQHGPTVDSAPAAGDVPQISVFGPQVLQIASDAKTLRLIVSSDGSGKLKAALGSLQLGTKPLRAGGNDLRFTLPKTVLRTTKSTRMPKAAAGLLTLTPLSTGGAAGKPITRRVVLLAPTAKVTAGSLR
jgi:hypothetical protein